MLTNLKMPLRNQIITYKANTILEAYLHLTHIDNNHKWCLHFFLIDILRHLVLPDELFFVHIFFVFDITFDFYLFLTSSFAYISFHITKYIRIEIILHAAMFCTTPRHYLISKIYKRRFSPSYEFHVYIHRLVAMTHIKMYVLSLKVNHFFS